MDYTDINHQIFGGAYDLYLIYQHIFYGGNGEIRTHGGLLALDGFQDRSIKPLCHISRIGYQFIWT